jgi:hypothetical protein
MFGYFYHGTIRKYVVAFGSIFNNISIARTQENGEVRKYRIPLAYGTKDHYISQLSANPVTIADENNDLKIYTFLPRMSFQIDNMTYDTTRKRNTLSKTKIFEPTSDSLSYSYAEVPYNIEFTLSILTRKMEDGLQIIEQILPYFSPEFTVSLDLGDFAKGIDIPITLSSFTQTIEHEGDLDGADVRICTWELRFNMRAYLYGPTKSSSVIKQAIAQFFDKDNEYRIEALRVTATGGTGSSGTGTGATLDPRYYGFQFEIFGGTATDADIFG